MRYRLAPLLFLFACTAAAHTSQDALQPILTLRFTADGTQLHAQAIGARDAFAIRRKERVELTPISANEFTEPSRYPLLLRFEGERLVINPGHWEQIGTRSKGGAQ